MSLLDTVESGLGALGVSLEVSTRLGSFTVTPSSGETTPGDSRGNSGMGAIGLAIFRWLNVGFTIHTGAGSVGPFSASL